MVKVAIPVTEEFLCTDFGACSSFVIYEIDKNAVKSRITKISEKMHQTVLLKWIEDLDITDLIVHQIDTVSIQFFSDTKINLFVGVTINTADYLIEEYLKGSLQSDSKRILQK